MHLCIVGNSLSATGATAWTEGFMDRLCHGIPSTEGLRYGTQDPRGVQKNTNGNKKYLSFILGLNEIYVWFLLHTKKI